MPKGVYKRTKECNEAHMKQFFCNIVGCNKKHYCKGLCNKHYDAQHHKDNKKHTMTLEEWFKSRKDMGWINEPLHLG